MDDSVQKICLYSARDIFNLVSDYICSTGKLPVQETLFGRGNGAIAASDIEDAFSLGQVSGLGHLEIHTRITNLNEFMRVTGLATYKMDNRREIRSPVRPPPPFPAEPS